MWTSDNRYVISGNPVTRELDLFHLVIAPTFACNLRCKHCYLPDHKARRMDWSALAEVIADWADIAERERGEWGGVFHLKGGEPSTMPYFEQSLAEIAETQTLRLMITTNGIILSEEAIGIMQGMRRSMSESVIVTVSVDGGTRSVHEATRGTGTFDKTWSTIERLIASDIPVHVNCIVNRMSMETVPQLLDMSLDHGVVQVNLLPFVRQGFGHDVREQWIDAAERYEWLSALWSSASEDHKRLLYGSLPELLGRTDTTLKECVAGYVGLLYVLPDGAAYSCPRLVHSDLAAGNVSGGSLNEVFSAMGNGCFQKAIPRTGNGSADYSCKGAVMEEVRDGNLEVLAAEESVRISVADGLMPSGGAPMAACFSRNI